MRAWIVVLVLAAGCGTPNKREIKKTEVNTEEARLTGYLEGLQDSSCSPFCGLKDDSVSLDEEVVQDEATLVAVDGTSCMDVIVRTLAAYDVPIANLNPSCALDSADIVGAAGEPAQVDDERFDVIEYSKASPLQLAQGMTDADLGEDTTRSKFSNAAAGHVRVVERHAKICCPGKPETSLTLSLTHEPKTTGDLPAGLDFLWIFVE